MSAAREPLLDVHLPTAFEPVHLATCDSAMAEAIRRARVGAPEGTLVWADDQSAARGRLGAAWRPSRGGLHCAVVLRPELAPERRGELVLLGVLALGSAIATLAAPLTELRYRWPNAVLLGDGRVAGVWLTSDREWLVLAASANVADDEDVVDLRQACLCTAGGNPEATAATLLAAYASQLVNWLGRWDDEGLAPVLRHFRHRVEQPRDATAVCLPGGHRVVDRQNGIDEDGSLIVEGGDGRRRITISEYMALSTD